MKRHTKLIAALMSVLLFVAPIPAVAAPTNLEQKQAEATAARERLQSLSVQMESAGEDLAVAQENLAKVNEQIKSAKKDLGKAQENLKVAQANLDEQVAQSYRLDATSTYLEVILGSTSFADFVTRISYMETISEYNKKVVSEYEDAKADLEVKQTALEERRNEAQALEAQASHKQEIIQANLGQQQRILDSLDSEVKNLIEEQRAQIERENQARAQAEAARQHQNTPTPGSGGTPRPVNPDRGRDNGNDGSGADPRPTPTPSPTPSPSPSGRSFNPSRLGAGHPEVVPTAKKYLGVPYVWGGTTPAGFDCSGFVQYVYRQHGISIPRTSRSQFSGIAGYIPANRTDLLKAGDLVFFGTGGSQNAIYHVGLYLGGGSYIHAPQPGDRVKISYGLFGSGDYCGAVRP